MKIDSTGISKLINQYNNQDKKSNGNNSQNISHHDSFDISKSAQELQKAKLKATEVSEARNQKVAQLKQQVKQGTYNVSGEEVAEKMLNQAKINKLV